MEKISKFNYEAFYLDYLEGNLSEEDAALLLDFLEKHPELKLEDDFLPEFRDEEPKLDDTFKAGLKQIDLANDLITAENAEQFIIAKTEGLLNASKEQELENIVAKDGSLQKMRAQYASARLKPDLRITFPDKDKLKRGRKIALWPIVSFAAAACITAFFFLLNSPTDGILEKNGNLAQKTETIKDDSLKMVGQKSSGKEQITEQKFPGALTGDPADRSNSTTSFTLGDLTDNTSEEPRRNNRQNIDRLSLHSTSELAVVNSEDMDIIERSLPVSKKAITTNSSDQAYLGFEDMKNPIKPVTNRLGDLINKEVDFRTAKASSKRSGGFLVKIGNFEISHKGN